MQSGGAWSGVWELTVDGNLDGKYYTYVVSNYGAETETIDPYAKACGANGLRGMVVNLDGTNPAGWANDKHLYAKNPAAATCLSYGKRRSAISRRRPIRV